MVVAAGGNYGFQSHMNNAPALADPAIDRYVLAVGASDSIGTLTQADDKVPAFSPWPKRGATRSVDLIAPGTHIQGLRVPDSYIDQNHPEGQLGEPLLPGQRHVRVGRDGLGRGRPDPPEVPERDTEPGQEAADEHAAVDISGKAQAIGGGELQLATALAGGRAERDPDVAVPRPAPGSLDDSRGTRSPRRWTASC